MHMRDGQGRGRRNVWFEADAGGGDGAEDGERGAEMVDRRKGTVAVEWRRGRRGGWRKRWSGWAESGEG